MNIEKKICLFIFFSILSPVYFFLPVDFIWFVLLSLFAGFVESIILLFKIDKRKIGAFILLADSFYLIIYLILLYSSYNYYHITWNIIYFIMTLTIVLFPCYILFFNKFLRKIKIFALLLIIVSVGLKAFIFDTKYYYEATGTLLMQDVRYFKKEGYYKVIGNHKLLRKNPETLTTDDYDLILYFLNSTDWLEENFPDKIIGNEFLADYEYLKKNCKYICSSIGLYNIIKCDIYCLSLKIDKSNILKLYFPKGTFSIYSEADIGKYYGKRLKRINNCYYEGILLPSLTEKQFLEWTR